MRRLWKRTAAVTAVVLGVAGPAGAGTGRLNPTTKKFDVSVSVRGNFTDAQLDTLKGLMQKASDLLGDATDDQHRLGKVWVCNNKRGGKNADVWRVPGTAGPRSSANIRGLGVAGQRVYLEDDIATSNAVADGGHVIAHEFGHYAYGIYDEYCKNCTSAASTVGECLATAGTASLMENFWLRGISEFCVSTNHDPDKDTDQSALNVKADGNPESSWETAKRHFPDLAVPATPVDDAPASAPIDWQVLKPETRLVLVIDRSGSMAGDRMANAIAGAQLFVDLLRDDDKVAVVDFDEIVTVDLGLTTADAAGKAAAKAAIGALTDRGGTAVWDGLAAGVAAMNAADPACQMVVILLTDGDDNSSATTQAAAVQAAKDAGIQVHTVGLGSGADPGLIGAAKDTSGKFFQVDAPGALGAVFATLQAESSGDGGIITKALAPIQQGEQATTDAALEAAGRATFLLSWGDPSVDLDLGLQAPDGSTLARASAPGVQFGTGPAYEFFVVDAAAAGAWKMTVSAVSGNTEYVAQAFGENANASLSAGLEKTEYVYPEPLVVTARPVATGPIVGAKVTALVRRADGSQIPIALFDDGDAAHGDMQAEDGTYSAAFRRFSGAGTYGFLVSADTAGAMLHAGEGLMAFPATGQIAPSGASNVPAPSFKRTTEASTLVSGDAPTVNQFAPTIDRARLEFKKPRTRRGQVIPQDRLSMRARFALSSSVNLATEETQIELGAFARTIPAGGWKKRGKKFVARGTGFRLTIIPASPANRLILEATQQTLTATANPVAFTLLFQTSEGFTTKRFREIVKKGKRLRMVFP
jgi:Mg-chelatase subunit ChlD